MTAALILWLLSGDPAAQAVSPPPGPAESRPQYRAFWVDAFHAGFKNPAQVDQLVEDLTAARANAVFVQMRRRGDVYFLKSLEPPAEDAEYSPNFDALDYLIYRAHERGLEVHAWFVVSRLWSGTSPPKAPRHAFNLHGPHAASEAMWMTINAQGAVSRESVDLGHPEVAKYLAEVILEPAKHYDLDGVHLDYIRYPEQGDWGWNPTAVERFQRLENRTGQPVSADPKWSEFRRRQVTDLVRQIYLRAFAIRPSIKISAAVITWGNGPLSDEEFRRKDAYAYVFQDWPGWLAEGILDVAVPMNYFAESRYPGYLDRWLEFEKDRQAKRAVVPGLGVYLNTIPESVSQLPRALAASAAGNLPWGLCVYSYASTNLLTGNRPTVPNEEFYRAVAQVFGEPVPPPVLGWKAKPERGHVYGWLTVEPGAAWLKDGATVWIESDTGGPAWRALSDSTGFFGAVDLVPDRYRVRVERAGQEIYRTVGQPVAAGQAVMFHIFLKEADFSHVVPRLSGVSATTAAPGDLLALTGANLAAQHEQAPAVPLPLELGGTQVVVNGVAAPLFVVSPTRIELQLPYADANTWRILVRRAGMESAPLEIPAAATRPVILGVRRLPERYVEIYASGLGPTEPPLAAGHGAEGPLHRVAAPVLVRLRTTQGEAALEPLYAGLAPFQPGRYQVNVQLPEGVTGGELRLEAGGRASAPLIF